MKRALLALAALAAAATAQTPAVERPSLAPYAALRPATAAGPGLTARFMGVSTVLLTDGRSSLLVDGFFTRPASLAAPIAPDPTRIEDGLRRAGIARLDAVMTAHSHFDHALDSAEVAKRTGAVLIGSSSTANIGRGAGLPEARLRVVAGGEALRFGGFTVRPFKTLHSPPVAWPGTIDAPLTPPAPVTAYKEGGAFDYLISHRLGRVLIVPSANFVPGMFAGVRADVVMLGVGGLGKRPEADLDAYWREVVTATGAKIVVPLHWDDFTLPLDVPLVPLPSAYDRFDLTMTRLSALAARDGVRIVLPGAFQPFGVAVASKAR